MKIALASDLHLEFGDIVLDNTESAEVLILGGDITVAANLLCEDKLSKLSHAFMRDTCSKFNSVIYIMGNHEHYHGDFTHTINHLKDSFDYIPNLYILDKEYIHINGVTFYCGTMWTSFKDGDPFTMKMVSGLMNDFRIISDSRFKSIVQRRDEHGEPIPAFIRPSTFSPASAWADHKDFITNLNITLNSTSGPVVVCSHHSPSHKSVNPRYTNKDMNWGYASDLDEYIVNNKRIKIWTHGHMHEPQDYMLGETRIVCNPRGYLGHESVAHNFNLKFLEV